MSEYPITVDGDVPGEGELARILAETEMRPFPRAAEREAWQEIAARPWIAPSIAGLIKQAEEAASLPPPIIRATDWAAYERMGDRVPHQTNAFPRRSRMALFCLAECFEHKGRFLDALLDESWAIAEESSWVMSAHLHDRRMLPDVENQVIDLLAAMTACQFGETLYLLGEEMDSVTPLWRQRVHHELRQRCVEPFLKGGFWWEGCEMNWNSVCHGGVTGAVLLADFTPELKARVLHKAIKQVRPFLKGFTRDGGCSEGPGYWKYGMWWFCAMAYYVDRATGGRVDLLADPIVKPVMLYPTNVILTGNQVAAFADCPPSVNFASGPIAWTARQVGAADMVALASTPKDDGIGHRGGNIGRTVLDVVLSEPHQQFVPPRDAWLPDLQVLCVRGAGREGEQLVLAAKGGHNGEVHNHNDVGQFIVHWRGESLICDLGAPLYTKLTFSPRRYELLATRAMGHNVPLVNGLEQPTGAEYCTRDVKCDITPDEVRLSMDLAGAYPREAGLGSLVRTLTLHRGASELVELVDEVRFADGEGAYSLPLYTVGRFERAGEGRMRVKGSKGALLIEFDPSVVRAELEDVRHGDGALEERFGPTMPRCTVSLNRPSRQAVVRVRILLEST